MVRLCEYENLLGAPLSGIHSLRIGEGIIGVNDEGIAVFDVVLAIAFGWVISKVFNISFVFGLLLSVCTGIILHRLFCVRTTIDKIIFK